MKHLLSFLTCIGLLASTVQSQQTAQLAGAMPTSALTADAALSRTNKGELSSTPVGFEENKGQVRTPDGDAAPFVRYRLSQGSTQLFLLENGIAYQFSRVHYPEGYVELMAAAHHDAAKQEQLEALREEVRLETFRMNMLLEGADPAARITTEGRSSDYTQYYNHDALDVHTYTKVTYHEVYPGIDWVVYTTAKGMKYDFVVRPGADPDQIRLRFEHHEELSVDAKGDLIHGNRMGRFTEERPVSFQDGKEVPTSFVLEGNMLRFALGNYDPRQTLIIDPNRIWGTYYGGNGGEESFTSTTDASGNVYIAGYTFMSSAIEADGHQTTAAGGWDGLLVKFNSVGQRLWATYYGGTGVDYINTCAADGNGNVYVSGSCNSATGIASGGHQNTLAGSFDTFLVKFNSAGQRQWGTYFGALNSDETGACATDASGNVYLAGFTQEAPTNLASGGHQNTPGGGGDAFLVKFNASGVRQWSTYYGGTANDWGMSCAVDGSDNVYLSGSTGSTTGIAIDAHQIDYSGTRDCFLVKFNSAGQRQWGTYYGGTEQEQPGGLAVDGDGNSFLVGRTNSVTGIASGGHQNTFTGGMWDDGFLVKFNSAGQRLWGTYYGGALQDQAWSCAVDGNGNSYMAGLTNSTDGIADGGHQNTFGGGLQDAFLVAFDPGGVRLWGTYYGGDGFEQPGHCTVDPEDHVYLSGSSNSASGIAQGGYQNTISGSGSDAFLVKFGCGAEDSDSDGIPDCEDDCPNTPGVIGSDCDDGDVFTTGDTVNADCICVGTIECTTAALQETEPNNSNSTANALPYGTSISGSLGACTPTNNTADHFSINPTGQGVLRVDACLSTTGTVPLDVTFRVRVGAGVLATFTLVAGANGEAITSSFEYPCQGIGNYWISVEVPGITDCMSYAFSYSILDPVFGNDPFPNSGLAHDTYQDGQNGFYFEASTYDSYNIVPPFNGLMTIEVQAEHAGPSPGTMEVRLYSTAGLVIQEWIVPTGASGVPITTTLSISCRGYTTDYDVRFNATECGTSYRWKYTMTAPLFATDPEPNNGGSQATPVAYDTFQEGQNDFNGESNSDYYVITPTINGVMHIEVQAEHAGDTEGAMEVSFAYAGVTIERDTIPVGANGQPITTTMSVPCRGGSTHNVVFKTIATCGTSYRWRYYTTDPYFANDVEPNNGPTSAIVLPEATDATGHLDFLTGVDNGGENSDFYRINLPTDGVLHVNIEAEHVDASATETLEAVIVMSSGAVLTSWDAPVGANSTPAGSSFSLPCRGTSVPHYLRLTSGTCGVSYRVSWSVTPPFYANDTEPNNSTSTAIPLDLSTNWYDGHIGFYNTTDDDIYVFSHPGGPWSAAVSAEHADTGEGSLTMVVRGLAGNVIQTFTVPVGGSSTPLTNTLTIPSLAAASYRIFMSDATCGVSYRLHCATDADNDGVCDAVDLCAGGPEPGTPCDDGNAGTVDDVITADCLCEGDITTGLSGTDATTGDLRIWPNPATDEVWIDIGEGSTGTATVIVRDLSGRTIMVLGPIAANAPGQYMVLIGAIAQGTYIIEVNVGGKQWSRRIVKA